MNIAYFGSPNISADLLKLLLKDNLPIPLVITQPDRPVGKKLEITPTPVKITAQEHGIEIFDEELKRPDAEAHLISQLKEHDIQIGVLFAYGALLKDKTLKSIPQGIWNVHPSLLPLYRGPSPTAYPLILGDKKTGVSIIELVKKLDAGPILAQSIYEMRPDTKRSELEQELTLEGYNLIRALYKSISQKKELKKHPQNESNATFTRRLNKNDGFISTGLIKKALSGEVYDVSELPTIILEYARSYQKKTPLDAGHIVYNLFRGLNPWPGIWTTIDTTHGEKRVKIQKAHMEGTHLIIDEVQVEGKNSVDYSTFKKSYSF